MLDVDDLVVDLLDVDCVEDDDTFIDFDVLDVCEDDVECLGKRGFFHALPEEEGLWVTVNLGEGTLVGNDVEGLVSSNPGV